MNKTTERNWKRMEREIYRLLVSLKKHIGDDYRASDDPEDNTPGMQVTIGTNDGESWSYQTGDNSYTGDCYSCRHWSVISLYRRDSCKAHASSIVDELAGLVADAERYETV